MKNFRKKGYLFVVGILFCLFGVSICYVNADSGYGYRKSYDSLSPYSNSSFYSGSSSFSFISGIMDSYRFPILVIFFACILFFGIVGLIYIILKSNQKDKKKKNSSLESDEFMQDIVQTMPDFNKEDFCKEAFLLYKELLNCWVHLDKNRVKEFVSGEFYDKFCHACDGRKNIEEVIDGVYLLEYKIIKDLKVDNGVDITVGFNFRCHNYLIDKINNCILMGSLDEVYDEYAEVIFRIDNEGNKMIVDRKIGMPYFSNNSLEKNIKLDKEEKSEF